MRNGMTKVPTSRAFTADQEVKPEELEDKRTEPEKTAEALGISVAKLQSMRQYAVELRRANPKIKETTVRIRILEKYHIKLA